LRRIRWAPAAADYLEQIRNYHYPSRAVSTVSTLYKAARSLKQFPYRGRKGEVDGTRELVIASLPYIIVYETNRK